MKLVDIGPQMEARKQILVPAEYRSAEFVKAGEKLDEETGKPRKWGARMRVRVEVFGRQYSLQMDLPVGMTAENFKEPLVKGTMVVIHARSFGWSRDAGDYCYGEIVDKLTS